MKVYGYNWATREYTGEDEADPNPLEPGKWLLPAYSTTKAPPELQQGQRALYDPETEEWTVEDNHASPMTGGTLEQNLAAIPYTLGGDETIGDLFNAKW